MPTLGRTAIVAGRSMGGLAAAAALASWFDNVLIIDRDAPDADGDSRTGVGQGHHVHNLQKGGELAIESLLPGTRGAMVAAGAVEFTQGLQTRFYDHGYWLPNRDVGYANLAASRWLLEAVVRDSLLRKSNVSLRGNLSLQDIQFSTPDRVSGIVVENEGGVSELLEADLIVDCTGRGSRVRSHLVEHGYEAVPEFAINMGISYTSAFFDAPRDALGGAAVLAVLPRPPHKRGAFVSLVEDGRWLVSLHTRFEKAVPESHDDMVRFAASIEVPEVEQFIRSAVLAGPVRSYRKPHATWRRFDKVERFPAGLLVLGDAITSFNPVYGQGMSVAWQQASALHQILAARASSGSGLEGLASEFFPAAMKFSREAWNASTLVDAAYDEVTGDTPPGAEQGLVFLGALRTLLADDPDLHRDYLGVAQMTSPAAALMTPERMARVMAAVASPPGQPGANP